jgi:hypothetical protein
MMDEANERWAGRRRGWVRGTVLVARLWSVRRRVASLLAHAPVSLHRLLSAPTASVVSLSCRYYLVVSAIVLIIIAIILTAVCRANQKGPSQGAGAQGVGDVVVVTPPSFPSAPYTTVVPPIPGQYGVPAAGGAAAMSGQGSLFAKWPEKK